MEDIERYVAEERYYHMCVINIFTLRASHRLGGWLEAIHPWGIKKQ